MSISYPLRDVRVRFSGSTHVGMKRTHNEDNFLFPEGERVAIVADGMGGHASGEVASQIAVETVAEYLKASADESDLTWPYKLDHSDHYQANRLITSVLLANLRIYQRGKQDPACQGMGTTLVATLFLDDKVMIGHVGDSRVYRLRGHELRQLTEDHSLFNDFVRMKQFTPAEANKFPHKNVIVRALGMKESVQVDIIPDQFQLDDVYLLCSDGLSGMVEDPEIGSIMRAAANLDEICDQLIQNANANGGVDNITCILARIEPL